MTLHYDSHIAIRNTTPDGSMTVVRTQVRSNVVQANSTKKL